MIRSSPPPAHAALRAATSDCHEMVDRRFGAFDLSGYAGYRSFLRAHARVLPPIEALLAQQGDLPPVRPRAEALLGDLATLGETPPEPLVIAGGGGAAAHWGMLYVIEGSRLGGGMIARTIPEDMPRAYLSATHLPGEWRRLLAEVDAASGGDPAWMAEAVAQAQATFGLYAHAAALEGAD